MNQQQPKNPLIVGSAITAVLEAIVLYFFQSDEYLSERLLCGALAPFCGSLIAYLIFRFSKRRMLPDELLEQEYLIKRTIKTYEKQLKNKRLSTEHRNEIEGKLQDARISKGLIYSNYQQAIANKAKKEPKR